MKVTCVRSILAPTLGLLLVGLVRGAEEPAIRITYDGAKTAVLTRQENGWQLETDGRSLSLVKTADGGMKLRQGDATIAAGKQERQELVLNAPRGQFLKLVLAADKVLIWTDPGTEPVEIRIRPDDIKVRQGPRELGKVKYYADTRKTKAKNAAQEELAVVRESSSATAGLGAFLLPAPTPEDKRLFAFLVLVALGR